MSAVAALIIEGRKILSGGTRVWWRFRAWLHARLYHPTEVMPAGDGEVVIGCSCGGYGQYKRNDDSSATVTHASCPLWRWRHLLRDALPTMRLFSR